MIRHLAAIVVVLCVDAEPLFAQGLQLNVTAATAEIHKFPSVGSPVIGKVTRGTVLEITRELGHWVRIWWPGGEGSAGYIHVTTGSITHGPGGSGTASGLTAQSAAAVAMNPQSASQQTTNAQMDDIRAATPAPTPSSRILLPAHVIGLGAGLNMNTSNRGFKATVRSWSARRFGFQFEVSRTEDATILAAQNATSTQFAPSLLYSLPDAAGSYVWLRPYIGGGATFYRSSFATTTTNSVTSSGMDFHAFGGGEFTLPSAPRFALSADLAYRRPRTSFFGFDTRTLNFSLSGHWYIK